MADHTPIEWTDATWNPITGCSVVSAGCKHCYAMKLAGTRLRNHPSRAGLTFDTPAGPVWNGKVRFNEGWLHQPMSWRRPRRIFVCAHGDLFHEEAPDEWIDKVFAVMALAQQHTFQVLTKRPERMLRFMREATLPRMARRFVASPPEGLFNISRHELNVRLTGQPEGALRFYPPTSTWPLPNVWLGVSVEHQAAADERIPLLLQTPAAVRWISAEPLLGPVDIGAACDKSVRVIRAGDVSYLSDPHYRLSNRELPIDWIVVGGESGPGARPMHPDWARSLRDQCAAAGVAFLHKQNGAWSVVYDRDHDDPDWRRCAAVERDTPAGRWLNLAGGHGFNGDRVVRAVPVPKKAAGRLLDGIEHNGFPC